MVTQICCHATNIWVGFTKNGTRGELFWEQAARLRAAGGDRTPVEADRSDVRLSPLPKYSGSCRPGERSLHSGDEHLSFRSATVD